MSDTDSQDRVRLDVEGGIATITLDRANKLNALYPEMILRLVDLIEEVRRNNSVRVLVLRGEGRAFCAGDDLSILIHGNHLVKNSGGYIPVSPAHDAARPGFGHRCRF